MMVKGNRWSVAVWLVVMVVWMAAGPGDAWGQEETSDIALARGQTVYVPAYSHIYSGDRERQIPLTVTLSIRNTDPENRIELQMVDYYDSHGERLEAYLKRPKSLGPMSTVRYVIKQSDLSGGSGANFLVRWVSEKPVNIPIIETINISAMSSLGISFTTRGRAIRMP
jgi:hypothetical protein